MSKWTWDGSNVDGEEVWTLDAGTVTILYHRAYWIPKPKNRALLAAAPELLKQLKAIQFGFNHRCPSCAGWDMSENGETDLKHTKLCPVARAIQAAEGK